MNKGTYLIALCFLAFGMASVEILAALKDDVVSDSIHVLWSFLVIIFTALWVNEDANSKKFEKPFELGFLIYIMWPITLPWYLFSTRGVDGIIMVFGFIAIYLGPWLAGLTAYVYFT